MFFSPDGSRISTARVFGDMEITGTVKTYSVGSGKLMETRYEVLRAVNPKGNLLAIQEGQWANQTKELYRPGMKRPLWSFAESNGAITFSHSGEWVAYSVQSKGEIVVRYASNRRPGVTIESGDHEVQVLALSPDGRLLVTAGLLEIKLWDVPAANLRHVMKFQFGVGALAFSPDGKRLVSVGGGVGEQVVRVWALDTMSESMRLAERNAGAAISPDGTLLAISTVGSPRLGLWDLQSGTLIRELRCTGDVVFSPTFSPDGSVIAGNCRGVITVWDVISGATRFRIGQNDIWRSDTLRFSPDGRLLAAGTGQDGVALYDWAVGKSIRILPVSGRVSALAFSPDGRILAVGSLASPPLKKPREGTVRIIAVPRGSKPTIEPTAHPAARIAAWETTTGRQLFPIPAGQWIPALAFRKHGSSLLAVSRITDWSGSVCEYDALTGKKIADLLDRVEVGGDAAFSPDRAWLASSGSWWTEVKLWRLPRR